MNNFLGLREREREWECEGEEAGRVRMHLHVKSFALCAFYFPQPPLFPPFLARHAFCWRAAEVGSQRVCFGVRHWATTFALGSEPEPDCESESRSPAVLLPISLLFSFCFFFFCAVATAEVLCNRHFCVLREGGSKKRPAKDHGEVPTNCEWQTTVRSEHLGNKHKYERAPCRIYNSEWHSTTSWHFESVKWGPNELRLPLPDDGRRLLYKVLGWKLWCRLQIEWSLVGDVLVHDEGL